MAVTTTHSTSSLASQLSKDYPAYGFEEAARFAWNPIDNIVMYEAEGSPERLLHELGHALLGHESYDRDVELVKMESEAWQRAADIAPSYSVDISSEAIEDHMDTYRDWLHARSTCPHCEANGLQSDMHHYRCIECGATWRVNEARTCGLRRYSDQ